MGLRIHGDLTILNIHIACACIGPSGPSVSHQLLRHILILFTKSYVFISSSILTTNYGSRQLRFWVHCNSPSNEGLVPSIPQHVIKFNLLLRYGTLNLWLTAMQESR